MIKITKNMVEAMYESSDNQEAMGSTYDVIANSIRMTTTLDNDVELRINVYAHYINYKELGELISEGETDVAKIFTEVSSVEEAFSIDCDDEYVLESEAENYLNQLHTEFVNTTKDHDFDMIAYKIENQTEQNAE